MFKHIIGYNPAKNYTSEVSYLLLEDGFYASKIVVFDNNNFEVGQVTLHSYEKVSDSMLKKFERHIISINEKTKCL